MPRPPSLTTSPKSPKPRLTDGTISGDVGNFLATPTGSVIRSNCPVEGLIRSGDYTAMAAYETFLDSYAKLAPVAAPPGTRGR